MKTKSFNRLLLLLGVITMCVTQVWATEWSWTPAANNLGSSTTATTAQNVTLNSKAWTSQFNQSRVSFQTTQKAIQIGANGTPARGTLRTTAFENYTITGITVNCASYSALHTVAISVGGDVVKTATNTSRWTTMGNISTGTISKKGEIVITVDYGGSARAFYLSTITITYEEDAGASCETAPVVSTVSYEDVTATGAVLKCTGGITTIGTNCSVSAYGFVYGTSTNPTTSNSVKTVEGAYTVTGTAFQSTLDGLTPNTHYYVRAYVTNGHSTVYSSNCVDFTTDDVPTYTKVTDIAQICDGSKVVIATASGVTMSTTQNQNNRGIVNSTVNGSVLTPATNYQELTLVDNGDDTYSFKVSEEQYLYSTNSGSNYLRTGSSTNAINWTISISDGTATIKNTTTNMYIKNNGTLISCYSSGQTAVCLWYDESHACVTSYTATVSNTIQHGSVKMAYNSLSNQTELTGLTGSGSETITLTPTPNTGYQFGSWDVFKKSNAGTKVTVTSNRFTMPAYNVTVSATFTAKTYTVTLNRNGASTGSEALTATYDATCPSFTKPTKTGYNFGGYYTGSGGTGTQVIDASGAFVANVSGYTNASKQWNKDANVTLYAKWIAKTTTVTLNNQSATNGGTANVTATYGQAMPAATMPTKTNYVFNGYYTATGGSGTQYYTNTGASARNWDIEDATKTLYAYWTEDCSSSITVTKGSESNGTFSLSRTGSVCIDGGNATITVTCSPSAHYHVTSVTATNGDVSGSENSWTVSNISANTTINVTFAEDTKYTVYFKNNGVQVSSKQVYAGEAIGELPAKGAMVSCDGESTSFRGWTTQTISTKQPTAPTYVTAETVVDHDNFVVNAVWAREN